MSFRIKTILGIAIIEGLLLMLLVYTSVDYLKTSNQAEIEKRASSTASLFAAAAKDAVISSDLSTLNVLANELLTTSQVLYVNIYDQSRLLVSAGSINGGSVASLDNGIVNVDDGILDIERGVQESGFSYGKVELGFDTAQLDSFIIDARTRFLTIAGIEMLLVALFSWLLGHYLTRNLALLKSASQRILQGESKVQIPVSSGDEIGQTMLAFNQMVKKVADKNQALESANIRLNAILQTAVDGFVVVDTKGLIEEVNPAVSRLFGYKASELIGQNVSLLMPTNERNVHDEYIQHYLESAEDKMVGKGRELLAQKKDGTLFSIELSISKMCIDDEVLFLGLVKDLSDVKRAQVAAQRTESILLATLEGSRDALITIDITGEVQEVNDAACLLFKYHSEQMIGQRLESVLFAGEEKLHFHNILEEYRVTGKGVAIKHSTQMQASRSDGKAVAVEVTLIPVQLGSEMLLTAFIRDISRRMEYETQLKLAKEQAEQGSEAKSRFLATMSHEIRSPLNAVLGSVDLILDSRLNKEQRIYANTAKEAGTSLLSTINDILDFSKIEAGQMVLEESAFSPAKLATQVLQVLSPKAQDKGIVLAIMVNRNVPESLVGDGQRLRQVLHNLIDNAIKFSFGGCVAIEMWLADTDEARLCCKISDQGIGISEQALPTLFEEFSQVHDSHNTNYSGTGLGLAICAELIAQMGGQIAVKSQQGKGSCFSFDLLLKRDESANSIDTPVPAHSRVLLVHPNEIYRELIGRQYSQYGVATVCVDSIESIFNSLQVQGRFNLVLIDEHCLFDLNVKQANSIKRDYLLGEGMMAALMTVVVPEASKLLREIGLEQVIHKPLSRDMMLGVLRGEHESSTLQAHYEPTISISQEAHLPILLAEDSPANQIVASALLNKSGFKVEIANNGIEALKMASTKEYGLILMDMRMPEMDGIEATQKILQLDPSQIVIAMTANVQKEDVELCMSAGMKDFVPKPVNRENLVNVVNQWIVSAKEEAIVKSDVNAECVNEREGNASDGAITESAKVVSFDRVNRISNMSGKSAVTVTLPTSPQDDEEQMTIIDETVVNELSGMLGEDAMSRMIAVFVTETQERVSILHRLRQLYLNGDGLDLAEIDLQAHTLKSSSGSFGAIALSSAAKKLELSAKSKEVSQVPLLLDKVISVGELTLSSYEQRFESTQ
ncbi:multi-sensor hybrid histidine kinase [Shewanella halifaxensis HAW-EB4]|uniref:Sensor protein FixL n=1 Tax=Shewanella halifaxensis (strain HAW-EB4) TaxID=458817 RepID=B0TN97_SHEHH|nr:PAS domain S-box protein [Shewanella halifaxensis]ABZ76083.1 multi-sensor hybrid histidine kinase [Shewanella halifaxensis HAW-EB4]